MATEFEELISPLLNGMASKQIDIYNEFSLQHELGILLRNQLPNCRIQFERNTRTLFSSHLSFSKREIDIVSIDRITDKLDWAIELKYPRNGQYPEQMFSFCRDLVFLEELKRAGFSNAGLLIFVDDPLFTAGPTSGIYGYFRGGNLLHGTIRKPTGSRDTEVHVTGSYEIKWNKVSDSLYYTTLQVKFDC